jgi:Uma2 family endonuclease
MLSPSTQVIAQREKLLAYRVLETLRYCLLVSQNRRLAEVYRRDADGGWRSEVIDSGELAFDCVNLEKMPRPQDGSTPISAAPRPARRRRRPQTR